MNFTKLTVKSAAKLGFLIGIASPALLFNPIKFSISSAQCDKNGLNTDEQKVLTDYECKQSKKENGSAS